MHPAFSVIFFTVGSGAGYGLFILMVLSHWFSPSPPASAPLLISSGLLATVLISAGLLSSTFHLANPKNAWRAFFRFRTSWLSREGVFAILFYPCALVYFGLIVVLDAALNPFVYLFSALAVLLALLTVFSTGMIYACLKTIRQWNTSLTPANYLLLSLASGSVLWVCMTVLFSQNSHVFAGLAMVMLLLAALMKAAYYHWIQVVTGPTINTATGFTRAKVRLLDTGHTAGTFLTDEFAYQAEAALLRTLKLMVFLFAFLIPLGCLLTIYLSKGGIGMAVMALCSLSAGLFTERWLFFAEARHVVNLYHGAQHT